MSSQKKFMNIQMLITGASPDQSNRNTIMRDYVVEGFREVLGEKFVNTSSLQYAQHYVKKMAPNIVLCFGSVMPDDSYFFALKKACEEQNSLLAFWLHDDPYEFDYSYRATEVADVIFSNDKWASCFYDHPYVFHLPMAASKKAHFRELNANKDIDLFFCGVAFDNRKQLIHDLKTILNSYNSMILGDGWDTDSLPFCENKRLSNEQLSEYYAKSSIVLNMGRNFSYANERFQLVASTPGPRTFEAAMAGALQLFHVESLEITEYYQEGAEIILFDSISQAEEKILQYFTDKEQANAIRLASQKRTIKEHTYAQRARVFLDQIEKVKIEKGMIGKIEGVE